MDYRTRFVNSLRGNPVDRLPFVETAKFDMVMAHSDWREHLPDGTDPRRLFGFDNASLPAGYECAPVDWYALPRFPEREIVSNDGYVRSFDGRWGRVAKRLPSAPARPWAAFTRVFEGHGVSPHDDWLGARDRFRPSADERLPADWPEWCARSHTAIHPTAIEIPDPLTMAWNLLGPDGDSGLFVSLNDRPGLVREMVAHLGEMISICAEKVCREARIDIALIGSDCLPILGPHAIAEFGLDSCARIFDGVRAGGVDLVCLSGRGDLRPLVDLFRGVGANGVEYIAETGDLEYLHDLIDNYGASIFCIGCIDGRKLLEGNAAIEREVAAKAALAKQYRMLPSLQVTRILPYVTWAAYSHYATCLREAVVG